MRFPEFKDNWNQKTLKDIISENLHPIEMPKTDYERLGLYCHAKGTFHEIVPVDKALDVDTMYVVPKDNLIVNITFAWEHAIAITTEKDAGKLVSHRFPTYCFNNGHFYKFYKYAILRNRFRYELGVASPGGAGRNRVLNKKAFLEIPMLVPSLQEQEKIAEFLFLVDERIEQQRQLVEALKRYKRGLLFDVFNKKIQFKNPNGVNFPKWESTTVSDVLNYEQPQKYIVASENYNDNYKTPVLTANKAFILGYTNENNGIYSKGEAIIYDDFTMDMKFATFNFKVKSSTIKILTCKESNDLYFMYNLLLSLNLKPQGHQRSYISILEPTKILVPCYEEQKLISNLLRKIDSNLERQTVYLDILENYKKGLLQQMFI